MLNAAGMRYYLVLLDTTWRAIRDAALQQGEGSEATEAASACAQSRQYTLRYVNLLYTI